MALLAGSRDIHNGDQYTGSLAEAIENAFMAEWLVIMDNAPKPVPNDQMRLLFIAVAQGLVRYLADNEASITVTVAAGEVLPVNIETTGILY